MLSFTVFKLVCDLTLYNLWWPKPTTIQRSDNSICNFHFILPFIHLKGIGKCNANSRNMNQRSRAEMIYRQSNNGPRTIYSSSVADWLCLRSP